MHAVRDVAHWNVGFRPPRKQRLKQVAAHLPVEPADPIDAAAAAHGQIRHVEWLRVIVPVAPAQRSAAALRKAQHQHLDDGTPVHSFATLLAELATIVRNTCRTPMTGDNGPTFRITTAASPYQQRALQLINSISL